MVATAIRTYDELVALQKDPAQFTDWLGQVAAEKFADVAEETIKSAVNRGIALKNLPGRPNMSGEPGTAWASGKTYDLARRAGFAPNDRVAAMFDGDSRGGFESLKDYLAAVYSTKNGATHPKLKSALSEAAASLGGALVPEEFRMELRMLQLDSAVFRGHCTVLPMGSMIQHWPYVRDVSHVSSVYGGVIGYWEAEAATLGESEPTFGQTTLTAHKLTTYTVISNEVMVDSAGALESFINQQFPKAMNFFEERAYFRGTGSGMPQGILNSPALISTTRDTTGHLVYQDLVNMSTHILPSSENNVVWFASPSVKADLYAMALNVGTGGSAVFINPMTGGAANTPPQTIFGRPLIFTEHCSALGTVGDLVCADLSYYLIGDRQSLAMEASPHVKFVNDQTVFRGIQRLDGKPWLESALTLSDNSTTVSPFIAVAT